MRNQPFAALFIAIVCFSVLPSVASAQTSRFSYQGRLTDAGQPASGTYSIKFSLWDAETGGTQIGTAITETSVTAVNGVFSVVLDFGTSPFTGAARYLEVEVKKPSESSYTTLSPRQQILASPYSLRTLSASAADSLSSSCVGCVTDEKIDTVSGSKVTGTVSSATSAASAATLSATLPVTKGGTGSETKNFVDLSTNQIVAGNKEFTGTTKFSGDVQFAGRINAFKAISGPIYPNLFSPSGFVFVGGVNSITVSGTQTVAASATASLGTTWSPRPFKVAICYQSSGGAVTPLAGSQTGALNSAFTYQAFTITATNSVLSAGTYSVGFCVGDTFYPIDFNDVVSGWVMVFEN